MVGQIKNVLVKTIVFCALSVGSIFPASAQDWDMRIRVEEVKSSVYDRPYSLDENKIDGTMLGRNTAVMFGTGIGTMAFLYMMPTSFTNWEDDGESPFKKWWENVSHAPVWDSDDLFLNYVTHPYAGAIYYMGDRKAHV